MCSSNLPEPTGRDEFFLDSPALVNFIDKVNSVRRSDSDPTAIVNAVTPDFEKLLADPDWLPQEYCEPKEGSGMGGGIGMWLLYRAGDGGLAFSSLVVPSGVSTPVHDHLAWGVVGLYHGLQDEEVFARADDGAAEDVAVLKPSERRSLRPGELYELLPETDIHRVTTTSKVTSVSLHLLGNDNGCIWRHRFDPANNRAEPFKSGWLNVPCNSEEPSAGKESE